MPDNLTLYVLLVIAAGVGFMLGRRERRKRPGNLGMVAEDYLSGLNHLLNERHDEAIDTFVERMSVDGDTVETHLALGSLVRRRGEVDKAIQIHQNLLARTVLSAAHRQQTELELARDYLVAGLLDRAESLLLELVSRSGAQRQIAQELLVEVYQREKDWEKAVAAGRELMREDPGVRPQLAHFQCEIARKAIDANDLRTAREALRKAMDFDSHCARAFLILASVELSAGRYRDVRRLLRNVCQVDPALVQETLAMFHAASLKLNDEAGYISFLREMVESAPVLPAIEALGAYIERESDAAAARNFMIEQLLRNPSLAGFVALLRHLDVQGRPLQVEHLALVRRYSEALQQKQSSYRCNHCGFGSHSLMWQCPSCRTWDSVKPVTGLAAPKKRMTPTAELNSG